jgi:IS4 transposase
MTNAEMIGLFEAQRPICVMAQMALERLLSEQELDTLFHEMADKQYHRDLLFSSLAQLMASVVLCRERSVNAAYKRRKEQLGVSGNAVYAKLERVETGLSQALVRYSYGQLLAVSNHLHAYDSNYVAGYTPKILDGNHLAATEHRLSETRNSTAAPLPGKSLVVLDPRREAIADLFPIEDGHAQERSALDEVITTIERHDLWIADRNFCTLKFLDAIQGRSAKFVIRKHQKIGGTLRGKRRFIGKTATGRVYEQDCELSSHDGQTMIVRQVEVELFAKTRDGDAKLILLTNLNAEEADALKVAEIYRCRWTIESAFQKLTTTLQCEVNTLCYPKAALFAFALACLAYNAVSLVLAGIRGECGKERAASLSFHYLSQEIAQAHDGLMIAIPPSHWKTVRAMSVPDFAARLREIARHINFDYFRKSKHNPRKPKPKLKHQKRSVHVSTAQLLAQRRQ